MDSSIEIHPENEKSLKKIDYDTKIKMAKTTIGSDKFKELKASIEKNRFFSNKAKEDLNTLRRVNEQEELKDFTQKQAETLICRLKIQVEEKERDLEKMTKDYEMLSLILINLIF